MTELSTQAVELLNKIAAALVEKTEQESTLGFGTRRNDSVYVFLNNKGVTDHVWFTRKDNVNIGIEANQFTGYLKNILVVEATRKNKEIPKLRLIMEGENKVSTTFEIGYGTNTAKCVIAAVASLTPQQAKLPITIQPYQSKEEESVVFVSVSCNGERVDTRYDSTTDFEAKLTQAQAILNPAD